MSESSRTVQVKAAKGERLTLADLKRFTADLDEAGAAEVTPIDGVVAIGGRLKELKARAVRFGDREGA